MSKTTSSDVKQENPAIDLQESVNQIYKFWGEFLPGENVKNILTDLQNCDKDKFIHPRDVEVLQQLEDSGKESGALQGLRNIVNGPQHKENPEIVFPAVPQPFMGDLRNPKILVVTFNPGYH
ncbi:MAG: hypothetical protein SOW59_02500, partial [Corynebacterium sp.]|nr:hypothetical protein [Corynebacterium sp.]